MDKKLILASLAGGLTMFLLGGLFYEVLFKDFFMSSAAAGALRAEPIFWAIIVGELSFGMLLSYVFDNWASIKTFAGGAKGGAILGLLFGIATGFVYFGVTTLGTLSTTIVDIFVSVIRVAIAGGVVGLVLGKLSS